MSPKWTIGLAPAESALRPRMAPDLKLRNKEQLMVFAAIPCKALGQAAHFRALTFWG